MLKNKRVTVTGGKGFLGQHLIKSLNRYGCRNIEIADLPEYNLTYLPDIRRLYENQKPDVVIHLAAKVGGIGFNQEKPAELFYDNLIMGTQLIHEAYMHGIEKFVALGTICAYPKFAPVPFQGRRHLERLSRGNKRSLRTGQKNDAGSVAGLSHAVWI